MTDQSATERIAELERKNAELLEALRYAVRQVPELATVPGIAATLASHQKEDKA